MSQMPRWYREQLYQHDLKDVLNNPYSDQADVAAAKEAIRQKLDQDDRQYQRSQAQKIQKYLEKL